MFVKSNSFCYLTAKNTKIFNSYSVFGMDKMKSNFGQTSTRIEGEGFLLMRGI